MNNIPVFLVDRLPDSPTLAEIFRSGGTTVTEENGHYIFRIRLESGSTLSSSFPVSPDIYSEWELFDATQFAADIGLLRIVYTDQRGWYEATIALPPLEVVDEYKRQSSKIVLLILETQAYELGWLIEGKMGKRWRTHTGNVDLNQVTHWQFPKPPVGYKSQNDTRDKEQGNG